MKISYFTTYPLIVISVMAWVIILFLIISSSIKNKNKKKVMINSLETVGTILDIQSTAGENSAFINIRIKVMFNTHDQREVISEGHAVIDVTKLADYQPGKVISLNYAREYPENIKLNILNPLEARRNSKEK